MDNYYWTWHAPTAAVLAHLPGYAGNPYSALAALDDADLARLSTRGFRKMVARAYESQAHYVASAPVNRSVAYFCAEYALDASLPIYSGGLGILAGDFLKAASDAALPLVAVGLLYHRGYFRQVIDGDGWQHEEYPRLDIGLTGLRLARSPTGGPLLVGAPLGDRQVVAQVWCADVGRVPLYLLDTDIDANTVAADREITQRLYGGDRDMRIRQEIVLGIAGARALRALGYAGIETFHVNEGHAAFLLLELMCEASKAGLPFKAARSAAGRRSVFTTHTPVPAGHDTFAYDLLLYYLGPWWRNATRYSDGGLLALGGTGEFSMTELALNVSRATNAVSTKHGEVMRAMFPGRAIGSITNGVHHPTWTGPHATALYDAALTCWTTDGGRLRAADTVPLDDVRTMHAAAKRDLLAAINSRYPAAGFTEATLTIGFARRMTGYKRANLIFRDPQRLATIAARGLQIIVAGKAHAADTEGKSLIAKVVRHAKDRPVRVLFVEGYDMRLAQLLVAGVDVWLSNPRRPLEASGTSGMKALLNGVPNLSVLDGWWLEGYSGTNGWAISEGCTATAGSGNEDAFDAESLYTLLEREVVPEFYDRPDDWTARMRRTITTAPDFTAQRMVLQYAAEMYGL